MLENTSNEDYQLPDWLPDWLTEGLEPEEIAAILKEPEATSEPIEEMAWEDYPDWLTEGMEKPSQQAEQDCLEKQSEVEATSTTLKIAPEAGQKEGKKSWSRTEVAAKLSEYEQSYSGETSQRQLATELGIPRTTLQHWLKRKDKIDAAPEIIQFFETPTGSAFLHRLLLGLHFVFTLIAPCGVRYVCLYLELTGLDQFVAGSYSPHQKVSVAIEEAVVEFGQEEQGRLSKDMPSKEITACEDETYHPETCLVAIEPASNYILLEEYAQNRQAKTWDEAVEKATTGLSVKIIQSTSDEGLGIKKHVKKGLGAHHSPDLFHVQQELVKGPSVALAGQKRRADKDANSATEKLSRHQEKKASYLNEKKPPPSLEKKIEQAKKKQEAARETLKTAADHQERVKQAIQGINHAYHPYDLQTGRPRKAEVVSADLEELFSEISTVATEANLSERCFKRIKKAKRVLPDMIATITFFFMTINAKIEALSQPEPVKQAIHDNLIPAIYLHLVAHKANSIEEKHDLLQRSEELLNPLLATGGALVNLENDELELIEKVAMECAQLFQRSSSCVEGRNGQLALFHHSFHRLSSRKLKALTIVHNFFIRRPDGTTAAERFFGSKPKDLFERILDRVNLPGRPAQKRSCPQPKAFLTQPAT